MGFVMKLQGHNMLLCKMFSRSNFKDRQKLLYVVQTTIGLCLYINYKEKLVMRRLGDDQIAVYNSLKDRCHGIVILNGARGCNK